jgi:uncharacterized SAM-binding protein YcdF (DUF218 family)
VLRVMAWVMVGLTLYVAVTFGQVWWTASHDQARPAEAILVLGAAQYQGRPSRVFQSRLDHAAALYADGLAPVVVVTGGQQPGDVFSEAFTAYAYLQDQGVPDSALRLEIDGRTSYESIAASARFLQDEGISEVILVSDGWHLARSAAIARSVGMTPWVSPTPESVYSTAGTLQAMVRETAGLAVGRVIGFRRLDRLSVAG